MERNTKANLSEAITPLLTEGCCLCTDGNLSYSSIVKNLDINLDHKRLVTSDGRIIDGVYHIQHVNSFISHWRTWMARFRGVGTAYLDHYLGWYTWMKDKGYGEENLWLKEATN